MRHFGISFSLLFVIFSFVTSSSDGAGGDESRTEKNNISELAVRLINEGKLPKVILRKYDYWSNSGKNLTHFYQSIPIDVKHLKDDIFLVTAPYRKTKSKVFHVDLWMEFPNITKPRKLRVKQFFIDITPVNEYQSVQEYNHCSRQVISAKARFPEDILELKFDVTSVYQACYTKDNLDYFKFRLRFYTLSSNTDVTLTKEKVFMFLIFKEYDEVESIIEFLPNPDKIGRLHHDTIMQSHYRRVKKPQLKAMYRRRKGEKPCELRHFVFNFDKSGWSDYVIFPKEYVSNNCRGRCGLPLPDHIDSNAYTIIKAIASSRTTKMNPPFCTAKDLAPLTMLVYDEDGTIVVKHHKDMIAKSCMCA